MKAIVKYAAEPGNMEIREVPEPSPAAGQIKIKVVAAGICGSDMPRFFQTGSYHSPMVLGHEFSGVICEAAPQRQASCGNPRCDHAHHPLRNL